MKLSVPLARDLVMLGLGSGGMVHELFMVAGPNPLRVTVSLLLLLGTSAINAYWLTRNPTLAAAPTVSPPAPSQGSSSSPSS